VLKGHIHTLLLMGRLFASLTSLVINTSTNASENQCFDLTRRAE
jgi:hypothetical protein